MNKKYNTSESSVKNTQQEPGQIFIDVDDFFGNLLVPKSGLQFGEHSLESRVVSKFRHELDAFLENLGLRSEKKRSDICDIVDHAFVEQARIERARTERAIDSGKPSFKDRNSYEDMPELRDTNIVEFLRIVWKDELVSGLYRSHLKEVDESAHLAVRAWIRNHPWPSDIKFLSRGDRYSGVTPEEIRAAARLVHEAERRSKNPDRVGPPINIDDVRAARRILRWSTRHRQKAARPGH